MPLWFFVVRIARRFHLLVVVVIIGGSGCNGRGGCKLKGGRHFIGNKGVACVVFKFGDRRSFATAAVVVVTVAAIVLAMMSR